MGCACFLHLTSSSLVLVSSLCCFSSRTFNLCFSSGTSSFVSVSFLTRDWSEGRRIEGREGEVEIERLRGRERGRKDRKETGRREDGDMPWINGDYGTLAADTKDFIHGALTRSSCNSFSSLAISA